MPRTVTKQVFTFKELTAKAKEKAVEWYRDLESQDSDWWDHVYTDAETMAAALGIELDQKRITLMNGGTATEPAIYFSGFGSQGDGACFEGRYADVPCAVKAIEALCDDVALIALAGRLDALQARYDGKLVARVKQSGHYSHSGCTDIDVELDGADEDEPSTVLLEDENELIRILRGFMDWIYRQLQDEDEHRLSDETITSALEDSDIEFEKDGTATRD